MFDPENPDYDNTPASPRRRGFAYAPARADVPPQVTIVTPFYNEGPIFHETVQSVLRQSFQQWEWIIVNDASPDPVAQDVLNGYRQKDARIRVIDQPTNQGVSAARNAAFRAAKADYAVHLDSDNLLEPTAIEKWLWFLASHQEFSFVKGYSLGFGAEQYWMPVGFHQNDEFLTSNRVDTTSMIRLDVHRRVGGFDESIRAGLEDWEFWLRCASQGFWGSTIPECLDWYRRRTSHVERWGTWDGGEKEYRFGQDLRKKFPHLWQGQFPKIQVPEQGENAIVPDVLPCDNILAKRAPRVLMIVPWLTLGGSDKFTLDLLEQLTRRGWETTIATTLNGPDPWAPRFGAHTPDVFILHRFLRLVDYPRFLRYLIRSRQIDVVIVTQSVLGYQLLPYLRAHSPDTTFVDYCHIEEAWKNGGYPGMSAVFQELLDLSAVASDHLKTWMVGRGASAERVQTCHINVDPAVWRPDASVRAAVRTELNLDDRTPVVLFAGRICAQKQPRVLAETLLRLRKRKVPFTALVAGDGPDHAWLKLFLLRHAMGHQVQLLGAVSSQRISELMKAADVFFLPSEWEGIALSIYEAMASGLPVVGADVGGQSELVTPDSGILLPRGTEDSEATAYADALASLLGDPQRMARMGQSGRDRICSHFAIDRMGERMVHLLTEAQRLHRDEPRPVPGEGLGHACATQAVEYVRLERVAHGLWGSLSGTGTISPAAPRERRSLSQSLYLLGRWAYGPFYRRAMTRGGAWYQPIADKVKGALLRGR